VDHADSETVADSLGDGGRLFPGKSSAVLIGLGVVVVVLFVVTTFAAGAYHRMQARLGRDWFQRGQAEMRAGNAVGASIDFRNALAYARNRNYLLSLAQALAEIGDYPEARGYLLSLWDEQPGDGVLNLELARLAARTGQTSEAVRYYQNAIYGVWSANPTEQRQAVRFELADYLLKLGDDPGAESDLIALVQELPPDAATHAKVADLFSLAGDPNRALQQYEQALKISRGFYPALVGAGEAAFSLHDYMLAKRYLDRATRQNPSDTKASDTLRLTNMILDMDPLKPRLLWSERVRRLNAARLQAMARLKACAESKGIDATQPPTPTPAAPVAPTPQGTASTTPPTDAPPQQDFTGEYAKLQALRSQMQERKLRENPDLAEDVIAEVAAAESMASSACGPATGADRALQLIADLHGVTAQ